MSAVKKWNAATAHARQVRLRKQGLCLICGQRPLVTGTRCSVCRDKQYARIEKRAQRLRAAGLCAHCGKRRTRNRSKCRHCQQRENQRSRECAAQRLAQGLCQHCGQRPVQADRKCCATCLEKERLADRQKYRRDHGLPLDLPKFGMRPPKKVYFHPETGQPISRKYAWQLAQKAKGLCIKCARQAVRAGLCRHHWRYQSERNRAHSVARKKA